MLFKRSRNKTDHARAALLRELHDRLHDLVTATDPTLIDRRIELVTGLAQIARLAANAGILSNLGVAYLQRYRYSELPADLERAIGFFRRVEAGTSESHPKRSIILVNLGYVYLERYQLEAQPQDLDRAIGYFEQVEAIASSDDPIAGALKPNLHYAYRERRRIAGTRER